MKVVAETARLEFREFSADDALGLFELNSDPEVIRYTGDIAFTDVGAAREFLENYGHYAMHGYGRWTISLKSIGAYVGFCGLRCSSRNGEVDLGFRIMRRHWNQGLGTEAAREALRLGFDKYGLQKVVGRAMAENRSSHRVLEKLGMVRVGKFEESERIWYRYELTA